MRWVYFVVEVHPKYIRQVSIYARRSSQGVSGSMFLTATARDLESTAEDGEERFGTNFTFAKDRRSESKLSKSAGYALGLAAWFARIMNYELLGWCCRAGRSTSYLTISQFLFLPLYFFTFLLFYSFTLLLFYPFTLLPLYSFTPLLFYFFTFLLFIAWRAECVFARKTVTLPCVATTQQRQKR